MDRDRKLAITVAAVIGVGFASIVGLSLVGRDGGQSSQTVAPAKLSEVRMPVAVPASVPAPTLATPPRPEPISAGTPEEASEPFQRLRHSSNRSLQVRWRQQDCRSSGRSHPAIFSTI